MSLSDDAMSLLSHFMEERNAWDSKWATMLREYNGDYEGQKTLFKQAEDEMRAIFQKYCKSDKQVDQGCGPRTPPTYFQTQISNVSMLTPRKVLVTIKDFEGEWYVELQNGKNGLRIVSRKYKDPDGHLEKYFL